MPQWVRRLPTRLTVNGRPVASDGGALLAIEDAGDDGVGIMHGQAANERNGVFVGA
jgi:hypothetical protein